jgi:hypothetical protein
MSGLIYGLCALTALLCAVMLLQGWRRSRYKLLLWSGLCFVGLTVNNILLIMDKLVFTYANLSPWRSATALISLMILLFGLVWETK